MKGQLDHMKMPVVRRKLTLVFSIVALFWVLSGGLWALSYRWPDIYRTTGILETPEKILENTNETSLTNPPPPPPPVSTLNRHPFHDGQKKCKISKDIWTESQKKYRDLRDDKFTMALQTYDRPQLLQETLDAVLGAEIPSLHEVVIVWNNIKKEPPKDYKSKHGVPVRYRKSKQNSLNQKLLPDPDFQTQAVLLSDDDVYYKPSDLEFAFQAWRNYGQKRLVGALPRCAILDKGKWKYDFCSDKSNDDSYSMIITNLSFLHISFLDYYWSKDPIMTAIRGYVDDHMNCEDIATNFMASMLADSAPLLVTGHDRYVNKNPKKGISRKGGHLEARSQCITDFEETFGCMPLREETVRIQRGTVLL